MPRGFLTEDGPHPDFAETYGAAEMPTDSAASNRAKRPALRRDPLVRRNNDLVARATVEACLEVLQTMHANRPGRLVRAVAHRDVDPGKPHQDAECHRQQRGRGAWHRGSSGTVPRPGPATTRAPTSLIPVQSLALLGKLPGLDPSHSGKWMRGCWADSSDPLRPARNSEKRLPGGPYRPLIDCRASVRGDSETWPSRQWALPCDRSTACLPMGWSRGSPTRSSLSDSSTRGTPGRSKRSWDGTGPWS